MKITADRFVSVIYDLNVENGEDRELKERATAEHPLEFIFGTGTMLPAFEAQLKGLDVNETFQFSLSPENAYGEYNEDNVIELPKKIFEMDGVFDPEFVKEGNVLPMADSDGFRMNGMVMKVDADTVVMNFNHQLAGATLYFSGKILDVRQATAEDVAKLNGCGCNCNGHDCSCVCDSENDCDCGCGCC